MKVEAKFAENFPTLEANGAADAPQRGSNEGKSLVNDAKSSDKEEKSLVNDAKSSDMEEKSIDNDSKRLDREEDGFDIEAKNIIHQAKRSNDFSQRSDNSTQWVNSAPR